MPNEERDVPPLDVLLNDVTEMQVRFDQQVRDAGDNPDALVKAVTSFVQNDLVSLIKDLVESSLFAFEDIQDMVNPVEIPASEAENIIEILEATKASNAGNPLLTQRIEQALGALKGEDDEDEDEDESDVEAEPS